jgi:hypothetical protein
MVEEGREETVVTKSCFAAPMITENLEEED